MRRRLNFVATEIFIALLKPHQLILDVLIHFHVSGAHCMRFGAHHKLHSSSCWASAGRYRWPFNLVLVLCKTLRPMFVVSADSFSITLVNLLHRPLWHWAHELFSFLSLFCNREIFWYWLGQSSTVCCRPRWRLVPTFEHGYVTRTCTTCFGNRQTAVTSPSSVWLDFELPPFSDLTHAVW